MNKKLLALLVSSATQAHAVTYIDTLGNEYNSDKNLFGWLYVGQDSPYGTPKPSSLNITNGATVSVNSDPADSSYLTGTGNVSIESSNLTVEGNGSALNVEEMLYVRNSQLKIDNKAILTAGSQVVSQLDNSHIIVSGNSKLNTNTLVLNANTNSTMLVSGGSEVIANTFFMSSADDYKSSYIKIDGADSRLNVSDAYLGYIGNASLVVSNGGEVNVRNEIELAERAGQNATITIGGLDESAPEAPGYVNASEIVFKSGTGEIRFNHTSDNYDFSTPISGMGDLTFINGTTNLTGDNKKMSGKVNVGAGSILNVLNDNALGDSSVTIASSGQLALLTANDFKFKNNLVNDGTITLSDQNTYGKLVTVSGNYTSNNGALVFNGALADDNTVIDKLLIKGNYDGTTNVAVNNIGGIGAETLNGIDIISIDGNVNGSFKQAGRIVAGAYDYSLVRGEGANENHWYLTSQKQPTPGPDPVPTPEPTPTPTPEPTPVPKPSFNILRPEAGSYVANNYFSNTMFLNDFQDRSGEVKYFDPISGTYKFSSLWMRQEGGHNRFNDSTGQLKTQSNRYVLQLGGDLFKWAGRDDESIRIGIMGGYGNNHSRTHSSITDYSSKASVNGYSAGLYATWIKGYDDKSWTYVDVWGQYSWFDNSVKGEQISEESYSSKGFTGSIEGGYAYKVGESGRTSYWLQPVAQLALMDVRTRNLNEKNGTNVSFNGSGNIMSRLGVRAYTNGHNKIDDNSGRTFEPYVEVNYIHNTKDFSVKMNNETVSQSGARNAFEAKVGVNGQLSENTNVWVNVSQQVGSNSFSDSQATLGIKYAF
ncbi:autotransporter outer membrane beta-barrel domain-containing protein [Salmonella enterica]|nr:autotransporter outer membrane beta-barrel domain-containing protein [Salmonella enterica]